MNSLKLLILLIIILFGIYLFQLRFPTRTKQQEDIIPSPSPKPTAMPSQRKKPPSDITPFYKAPTSSESSSNSSYQYPGSSTQGNGMYTTSDSPAIVTQWYKDAITRNGFTSTTVIQTTTNSVTYNKLVAAKAGKQISIEIKKPADSGTVTIVVSE